MNVILVILSSEMYRSILKIIITLLYFQVVTYTISFLWCLAIIVNQIDYIMKPWIEDRKEVKIYYVINFYVFVYFKE